ncbi:MAG TPA: multidrug efflux RND transporter permease subunit [Phenylobacterium sp.]|uniref:efflux RND transporter permease subunit n=1 Tax=Phenylobacterium sp. TaxID=1871053 RepID=UPI002B47B21F|nr:multidrug efflux RND transporter permease subunit [Phenylobacterium sp.]HKR86795.1 multidrug efflux RND transporter permease subunit [Phenylobacterium sp.]
MRFPHFFIDRPIFAAVLSTLIVLVGVISYPTLPVAQYPEIAPPTVVVNASYPGASAETLAQTVATPLEESINGVENMIYMSSSSTGDGAVSITVTFRQGANIDQAQVLVQNRVSTAEPRLPDEVRQIGVTVRKNSPDLLMVATLISPDGSLPQQYLSNYATLQLLDRIARVPGVGAARLFGGRDYNMRVWIDPDRATTLNLTVDEIVAAVRAQNAQVAAGAVGQPPFSHGGTAFQLSLQAKGRLTTPEEFGDIIVKRLSDSRVIRLRDVARIELGAQDYSVDAFLSGKPTVAIAITQLPGSNALSTAQAVRHELDEAAKSFPSGMIYRVPYNPTEYIAASIDAVEHTLFEAVLLVALVVILFLQSWRAAIIPIVAIPVSLIGSFATLAAFGFSLNNLSLFGMVLAIGIVVDDAIVVVENVERLMEHEGMTPREAAHATMDEVSGALIAIALVLIGVFLPTTFIPGISGQFYKQFALTIISATAISAFVSLTLSPAMAALVLQPKHGREPAAGWRGAPARFARTFNRGFDWLSERYGRYTARAVRALAVVGIAYACLIGLALWRFSATPGGFIPAQDQGYLIGAVQMPPGASLQRTTEVLAQAQKIALNNPAAADTVAFAGFDGATFTNAPNTAAMFVALKPKGERAKGDEVANQLRSELGKITAGNILVIAPPPVRGIGTGGGYKMMIEDRSGADLRALEAVAGKMAGAANQTPGLKSVFTPFNTRTPRLFADIDRERAEKLGVPVEGVFATLGTYLGSTYINDFNFLGRTFRVTAQADAPYRDAGADVARLRTRSDSGSMVPLASVMSLRNDSGPYRVVRYNLYPAAELQGDTAAGYSSGQSLKSMERLAAQILPQGFAYDWTELAFQQKQAGNTGAIAFGLAVVFVFLLLAAQYESLVLPLAVILIVPMCLLAAILGVNLMRLDNNILTQIGLVVLIGLAAKNAILIVEFAKQNEEHGQERREAARNAAATRLRPILMTSIAFILGTLPLVISNSPGSEMRQALGVAVFFGMIGVTLFGLLFTPAFYVISRNLGDWVGSKLRRGRPSTAAEPAE